MGKNLAVFRDSCFSLHSYCVKMQKSTVLGEKMILRAFMIDLKYRWFRSGLEKHKTLAFLFMVDFYALLKQHIFLDF